jgi:hypothetical protein
MHQLAGQLLRHSSISLLSEGRFGQYRRERRSYLAELSDAPNVQMIGGNLIEMFTKAHGGSNAEKSNQTVAIAGSLWQALCLAYINTSLAGTSSAAISNKNVPESIKRMFVVKSGSEVVTQTYSTFVIDHPALSEVHSSSSDVWGASHTVWLDREIRENPEALKVILLDCRTNFNDAIKEPLLYDWIIGLLHQGVLPQGIRREDQFPEMLNLLPRSAKVSLAVATATKKDVPFGSAPARRASCLTGGMYWGKASKSGVATSLAEFVTQTSSRGLLNSSKGATSSVAADERDRLLAIWT